LLYAAVDLEPKILALLKERPGLDLAQLAELLNVKKGPADNPLKSPLNKCLADLRDLGKIRTNNQWGEPRFFLTDTYTRAEHRHICRSKFHEGPRERIHFDRYCAEPTEDECLDCHDEELYAAGARWETAESPSDADPGL
jgi:hypothetical protein